MEAFVNYFAYGSNMSPRRLQARVPDARPLGVGALYGHELRFHKRGRDGSGKCDAFLVEERDASLWGVLFEIPRAGKAVLDSIEGLGAGYAEKSVCVLRQRGGRTKAVTYYATDIDVTLKPFCWYRHHVITGAREFALPTRYQDALGAVEFVIDPDRHRRASEYALYPAAAATAPHSGQGPRNLRSE
jgi:gamma-glutamylcyclotransferase